MPRLTPICLVTLLFLTACASDRPSADLSSCRDTTARKADVDVISAALAPIREAAPGESLDILCLSGGGRNGAWGAGVLNGWNATATFSRPARFAVVAGVSAGALLATHAFLGTNADLDKLRIAFAETPADAIIDDHGTMSGVIHNGLTSLAPLRATMPSIITPEDIRRVAATQGRALLVATVDLDCGDLVFWLFIAIARANDCERYWDILVASCAAPGFSEPVFIDGNMHADGWMRAQAFFAGTFEAAVAAFRLSPASQAGSLTGHIYAIQNGRLGISGREVDDQFVDIAMRGLEVLLDAEAFSALRQVAAAARRQKMPFSMTYLFPEWEAEGTSLDFDLAIRQRLYNAGFAWAHGATEWPSAVPPSPVRYGGETKVE